MPRPVREVGGHAAHNLSDFAGETSFVVYLDPPVRVWGAGRIEAGVVRFHEKDHENGGKDIRVWTIWDEGLRKFVAEQASQF
jgi:hypothetical protein